MHRAVTVVAVLAVLPFATPLAAQGQQPAQPPAAQPAAPQPKPYKPVTVSAPPTVNDPAFEAFRKQIADIAQRKDRGALAKLVVTKGFFWQGEKGEQSDKKKSGIDNLTDAFGLTDKESFGWDALAAFASDPTGAPLPERKDVVCSPADPQFDGKALEELAKTTGTDELDWAYPVQPNIDARASAQPNAPVVEKIGMHFVWIAMDENHSSDTMIRIVTPSGQYGFVPADAFAPLGSNQVCYAKEGGAWKIAGVVGDQ
jgi:hypothetical protein